MSNLAEYGVFYTATVGYIKDILKIDIIDFEYPVFTPPGMTESEARTFINNAWYDHFYFSEIAQETIEQFKHYLKERWLLEAPNFKLIQAANATLTAEDAFVSYERTSTDQSVFNDKPIGVVAFDNTHASAVTNNTHVEKGDNTSKFEDVKKMRNDMDIWLEDFFDKFNFLFINLVGDPLLF